MSRYSSLTHFLTRLPLKSLFVRHVASTFVVQTAALILGIGTGAITARWLGADGKGLYQLAMFLPAMLNLFLSGGIGNANVYYASSAQLDLTLLAGHSTTVAIIATILGSIITMLSIWNGWLTQWLPGIPAWLVMLGLLNLPLGLLQMFYSTILQGRQKIALVSLISLLQSSATLLFTIVAVIILQTGLAGAFIAYLCSMLLSLSVTAIYLRREGAFLFPQWNLIVLKPLFAYGLRGYVGNLLQFYNYRLDTFIVNYYLGAGDVGIYGVAVRFAELLWRFPDAVSFVIFPKAAATQASRMNRYTPRVFFVTLGITLIGAIGLSAMASFLIQFIYGDDFRGAYWPLLALLPGVVLLGAGKVLTSEIAGRGYPQYNSINSAFSLLITIGLDLALIPRWGIIGAAIASSAAYTVTFFIAVAFYLLVRRKSSLPLPLAVGPG